MPSKLSRLDDAETLRGLVRGLREGIYVTDRDGRVLDANGAFLAMFGVSSLAELQALPASELVVDLPRRAAGFEILRREGAIRDFEMEIRRVGGEIRTVIDSATCARDPETGEEFTHGILIDITDRKLLEQRLLDQSLRDPLTGCFNRRYLNEFERRYAGSHPSFKYLFTAVSSRYSDWFMMTWYSIAVSPCFISAICPSALWAVSDGELALTVITPTERP